VHAEGERMLLTRVAGERQEIDLAPPPTTNTQPPEHSASTALPAPVCPQGEVIRLGSEAGSAEAAFRLCCLIFDVYRESSIITHFIMKENIIRILAAVTNCFFYARLRDWKRAAETKIHVQASKAPG